jgi:hypothetical protein
LERFSVILFLKRASNSKLSGLFGLFMENVPPEGLRALGGLGTDLFGLFMENVFPHPG